jgi:hypothetical protein
VAALTLHQAVALHPRVADQDLLLQAVVVEVAAVLEDPDALTRK